MANLNKISILVALTVLISLFTGCKKETPSPSFTVASSSVYFEYGQTKEVSYSATDITKFGTPAIEGDGWTCTRSGGKYTITAPTEGNGDTSAEISLTASTDISLITRKISVAVVPATLIPDPANCHVVSAPGTRYKFAALRADGTEGNLTEATNATRVWTTDPTAVDHISFENGYIYFSTETTEGALSEANALVAATDQNGKVLWSWHLWITATDPESTPAILNGTTLMNRNLGAFASSDATPEDAARSYGLFYQWGRKDPFVGPAVWNSTAPQSLYNASDGYMTHTYTVSSATTGTTPYSIENPNVFVAGAEDNDFDRLFSAHDNTLWSDTEKSLYDPCPAGWRVAPASVWASFSTTQTQGSYTYGWNFTTDDGANFFAAAGRRNYSPTLASSGRNYTNVINDDEGNGSPVGFYWSSSQSDTKGTALQFTAQSVDPAAAEYLAGGFPVRCIAE